MLTVFPTHRYDPKAHGRVSATHRLTLDANWNRICLLPHKTNGWSHRASQHRQDLTIEITTSGRTHHFQTEVEVGIQFSASQQVGVALPGTCTMLDLPTFRLYRSSAFRALNVTALLFVGSERRISTGSWIKANIERYRYNEWEVRPGLHPDPESAH